MLRAQPSPAPAAGIADELRNVRTRTSLHLELIAAASAWTEQAVHICAGDHFAE